MSKYKFELFEPKTKDSIWVELSGSEDLVKFSKKMVEMQEKYPGYQISGCYKWCDEHEQYENVMHYILRNLKPA